MSEVKRYETSWDAQAIYDLVSVVAASDFDAALAREAALREDLARQIARSNNFAAKWSGTQQRLTVADELVRESWRLMDGQDPKTSAWHMMASKHINSSINPAAQHQGETVTPVLPERQIIHDTGLAGLTRKWAEGWNEALDEVTRLNKPQYPPPKNLKSAATAARTKSCLKKLF